MHRRFANRPLFRRVIALAAAYAIALSSLIASFGAVRAAVADATSSDIVICQQTHLGKTAPASDHGDCSASCCVGCLMLLAAVPPPPAGSVAVRQSPGRLLALPATIPVAAGPHAKSHRSRAPPLPA